MEFPNKPSPLPATPLGLRPGDFPLGSLESRAAARAMMLKPGDITHGLIMTGLPWPDSGPSIVNPPDTVAYHVAPDNSIVEVICREYELGSFTAFIHQTWENGSVYEGDDRVEDFADLEKFCRPQRTLSE